jgi:hypothetical protein
MNNNYILITVKTFIFPCHRVSSIEVMMYDSVLLFERYILNIVWWFKLRL